MSHAMNDAPRIEGAHSPSGVYNIWSSCQFSSGTMEQPKKRRIEFTLPAITKRVRFCLETIESPSLPCALAALGLLGPDATTVRSRLVLCAHKSRALLPEHVRACPWFGLRIEKWQMLVVQQALQETPFQLHDCKRAFTTSGGWRALLDPTRMFLVEGHLNARYTRSGRNAIVVYTMRDDENTEQSWRCMIALKGGRLYSPELPTDGLSIANMWLEITPKRVLRVLRVMRVMRVTTLEL